jgi:hypothetical protein
MLRSPIGGYRSRERKRKAEASEMQKLHARIAKLEKLESQRATGQPSQRHEATPEVTPPSQRRSSVASMELVQPDFTAPRYPVDSITEAEHCELMTKCQNLTLKADVGSVVPPQAEGTFHCRPIPHGYAVVTVDEIMEGFEELELDYPTGEGEIHLINALRSSCLWRKEYIKLPNWTPPPPPPPPVSQGTPPPPPPPASDQGTLPPPPPPPAREGTPPPPPPPPARRSTPPPPACQPTPPRQQRRKRAGAAPAASSTRGGKKFKYGPSLKPLEKLPYERTNEENTEISAAEVEAHFARKPPPPKETID